MNESVSSFELHPISSRGGDMQFVDERAPGFVMKGLTMSLDRGKLYGMAVMVTVSLLSVRSNSKVFLFKKASVLTERSEF